MRNLSKGTFRKEGTFNEGWRQKGEREEMEEEINNLNLMTIYALNFS